MVTIHKDSVTATISGYSIACNNPSWLTLLECLLDPEGPSGSDPDPDYTLALRAVQLFGFRIDGTTAAKTRTRDRSDEGGETLVY